MRTRRTLVVAVVAVGIMTVAGVRARQSTSAEAAFETARKVEVVDGDLPAAVALYRAVVEAHKSSNPGVAARALVQMAAVYARLGDTVAARKSHARVVDEFSNQTVAVATARKHLQALGPMMPAQAAAIAQSDGSGQRIRAADGAVGGSLSADGRFLAFSDRSDGYGTLVIRDLATGESRRLTPNSSTRGFVGDALISPDGRQVAYRWNGGPDESTRVIRSDGTNMRVLTHQEYGEDLHAWSPDGKVIAAVRRNYNTDGIARIVLISTADGSVTQLKSTGWQEPAIGGFSPDGRFLVVWVSDQSPEQSGIFLLATDASRETRLVADGSGPRWSPDGSRVAFVRTRAGNRGLWAVRVANGRPTAEPELLRSTPSASDFSPKGFSADGSYYYAVRNYRRGAYIADFNAETLAVTGTSPIGDPAVEGMMPEISPDGRQVALVRAGRVLVVRSLETGEERSFEHVKGLYLLGRFPWLPDNRTLLVLADQTDSEGARPRPRVLRVDTRTGGVQTVFEARGTTNTIWPTLAVSPDGRHLFYSGAEIIGNKSGPGDPKRIRLIKRSLETGTETQLHMTESLGFGYFGLTVSPNATWLAFSLTAGNNEHVLMLMRADGGTAREIRRWPDRTSLHIRGAMAWTPDSRQLILTARCGTTGGMALCALPREGGDLRLVVSNLQDITSRTISVDGRRIAFTGSTEDPELWVIRDLLRSGLR